MMLLDALAGHHRKELKVPTQLLCCNPAIVRVPDGWRVLVRALDPVPLNGSNQCLSTQNWMLYYAVDFTLLEAINIDDGTVRATRPEGVNGLEDGRLFLWKENIWALFSGFQRQGSVFRNTMMLARWGQGEWVESVVLPSPEGCVREKNWMPCVVQDTLFIIYSIAPLRVFRYEKGMLSPLMPEPQNHTAPLRGAMVSGSSPLVAWEDGFLAVVHHRRKLGGAKKLYLKHWRKDPDYQLKKVLFDHYLVKFDRYFNVTDRSKSFSFECDGVEFCSGLHVEDSRIFFSYGVKDRIPVILDADFHEIRKLLAI